MQWTVFFLWNKSWNCVLLFDTQSFMCFLQQTARGVSTTSVSRVPESRNLKCRHRVMRSELQRTACVQNFGVELRETAELASVCSQWSSPSTNMPHILSPNSTRSFKMLTEKLRKQTSQNISNVNELKSCTRDYEASLSASAVTGCSAGCRVSTPHGCCDRGHDKKDTLLHYTDIMQ